MAELVELTMNTMPKGATRWSARSMAGKTGVWRMTVHLIWPAFSLKLTPERDDHAVDGPLFVDRARASWSSAWPRRDRAVVLCVDEKLQIQLLDRTQPVLPVAPEASIAYVQTVLQQAEVLSARWAA